MMGTLFQFSDARVRHTVSLIALVVLAACGGANRTPPSITSTVSPAALENAPRFANGPISAACRNHNRGQASAQKCGCIQAAANLTLSQAEQQRASRFFAEPELLQAIKLSDTPKNERFWETWAGFAETAEQMCK